MCFFQDGVSGKLKSKLHKSPQKAHWLDYAEEKYGLTSIAETKTVVNILKLYLPLPIYWAVYTQQGSRWIFQATRMNGDLGFYTIKPDQMIIFNSLMGICAIPVCNYVIYPALAKIGIKTYLHKMTLGGFLAAAAFVISAFVQIQIADNFISIFWLVPQYLVLAISENFVYIANVSFAYAEAPPSMKSVMQAFIFLTIAIGDAIVAIISGTRIFESRTVELFFFAGVLCINQVVFGILAYRYERSKKKSVKEKASIEE